MVIYEGIGCRLKGKWGAKAQQTAWIKNTADCIPVEIDPAALLLSSSFSLSLSNTHMHTLTLLRPRPHFHGPKIEASTWLTEKQKEASESRFSPKTNCLPLWRRKKKEARHHKEEVSPAILTLLPPPVLLQCNWVWSLSVRRSLSDPLKLRLTAGKVCYAKCFFYTGHPAKLRK